ncbi:hypothetical protein PINS_up005029 [Pythium insidiosum]|nr:hypothetical protein PINS_up005029 [Pythium insidiosum]
MNDPFAAFDPINNRSKTGATTGSFATLPTPVPLAAPAAGPYNQFNGAPMAPSMAMGNPFGAMPPTMQSGGAGQLKPFPNGASFMTQPSGPPAFAPGLGAPAAPAPAMNPFGGSSAAAPSGNSNPFGAQPIMYDSIKNLLQPQPSDPFATSSSYVAAPPASRPPPAPLTTQSSTVIDFDPFSPRDLTPRSPFEVSDRTGSGGASALADRQQSKRQTQDATRSQLTFDSSAFQQHASAAPKVSLTGLARQDSHNNSKSTSAARPATSPFDDGPFFSDNSDAFAGQTVSNLDDDFFSPPPATATGTKAAVAAEEEEDVVSAECPPGEYDVTFDSGRKLGVLMERVDVWGGKREERRQESAVVKLVVENGAADRVGVTIGSSVVAINGRSVANATYTSVLELIKSAPRPMTVRFKRGTVNKDTTQGNILTRISSTALAAGGGGGEDEKR